MFQHIWDVERDPGRKETEHKLVYQQRENSQSLILSGSHMFILLLLDKRQKPAAPQESRFQDLSPGFGSAPSGAGLFTLMEEVNMRQILSSHRHWRKYWSPFSHQNIF